MTFNVLTNVNTKRKLFVVFPQTLSDSKEEKDCDVKRSLLFVY